MISPLCNRNSLEGIGKTQNLCNDLLPSIHTIQKFGLEVQAGFIVGFDHNPPTIFEDQFKFFQASGIPTAMVSILFAFPGSRLSHRLEKEERLLDLRIGDHAFGVINFRPKMDSMVLRGGHLDLLEKLYSPKYYYQRVLNFLEKL